MSVLISLVLVIVGGTMMWSIEGGPGTVDLQAIGTIILATGCLALLAALYEGQPPDRLR